MGTFLRKTISAGIVAIGAFFVLTFQGWGMIIMRRVGFELALGESAVRHVGDGQVLLTNPLGQFLWSSPFLAIGIILIAYGIRLWRRSSPT